MGTSVGSFCTEACALVTLVAHALAQVFVLPATIDAIQPAGIWIATKQINMTALTHMMITLDTIASELVIRVSLAISSAYHQQIMMPSISLSIILIVHCHAISCCC